MSHHDTLIERLLAQSNGESPPASELLEEAAGALSTLLTERAALWQERDKHIAALAACYRMSGADDDGNEDWRLADHAIAAVTELREDYDNASAAEAELSTLRAAVQQVVGYAQHKPDCPALPANHGRFTFESMPWEVCACSLADALASLQGAQEKTKEQNP